MEAGGVLSGPQSSAIPIVDANPTSLAFSHDEKYIVTADFGCYPCCNCPSGVTVFSLGTGTLSGQGNTVSQPLGSSPASIAFSPNGTYLATADFGSNQVTVFTLEAGGILSAGTSYSLPSGSINPYALAFSPSGEYLVTANGGVSVASTGSNDVTMFAVAADGTLSDGTSYPLPAGSTNPWGLAFSPSGQYLVTVNYGSLANGGIPDVTVFTLVGCTPSTTTGATSATGTTTVTGGTTNAASSLTSPIAHVLKTLAR